MTGDSLFGAERPPPLHVVAEVARLAALRSYHVLDTVPSAEFDLLARRAAECLRAPMAAISLVDADTLWLKAAFGLEWRRTQRRGSFCHHAIAQPGPLVVPDAAADPRFRDHPAVQGGAGLRFYAGVCLEDADGYRLGTLSTFDLVPRSVEPEVLMQLSCLGIEAMAALAAHRDAVSSAPAGNGAPAIAVTQGWLGVRTARAGHAKRGTRPGLIVLSVAAGSPAYLAGLRTTDVLVAIDGHALRHPSDVARALSNRPIGGTVVLELLRAGQVMEQALPIAPEPPSHPPRRVVR